KTASVRRFFPDSLLIQLTERRPELRMELPQGLTALLDDDGVVLGLEQSGHTPAAGQRPLVLLRGLPYAPQPGQTIRDRLLDTARSAVSALDPYALAGSAAPDQTAVAGQVLVELGDPFRIGVQLPGPVRVLTPPEYIEEALEIYPILGRLLPDIVGKNREIDFSPLLPGRRVVIRPIR
ncbi:MAG: hypothetical protein OEZ59_14095, partial [Deltaproteobacteria bacterium]|nr:hypothetical protein [Deltaproteobacteria bacterium]